jgi:hypothetical protein
MGLIGTVLCGEPFRTGAVNAPGDFTMTMRQRALQRNRYALSALQEGEWPKGSSSSIIAAKLGINVETLAKQFCAGNFEISRRGRQQAACAYQ